jgi:hypothetical protein
MKLYSSAGFANVNHPVIGQGVVETAHGMRTGLANNDGHDRIAALVEDALRWGDSHVFIVAGWDWRDESKPDHTPGAIYGDRKTRPDVVHIGNQAINLINDWRRAGGKDENLTIDVGNELDITDTWRGRKICEFRDFFLHVYDRIRSTSAEVKIVSASSSNWRKKPQFWRSRRGYETLKALRDMKLPADTLQGLHPYRNDLPFHEWHDWDHTEGLEVLRDVLDGRTVAITEMGWHSRGNWNDEQIADFINAEIRMWRDFGADSFTYYQIQDGPKPDNSGEGGFGAFTSLRDGFSPKPVARVLKKWKGLL